MVVPQVKRLGILLGIAVVIAGGVGVAKAYHPKPVVLKTVPTQATTLSVGTSKTSSTAPQSSPNASSSTSGGEYQTTSSSNTSSIPICVQLDNEFWSLFEQAEQGYLQNLQQTESAVRSNGGSENQIDTTINKNIDNTNSYTNSSYSSYVDHYKAGAGCPALMSEPALVSDIAVAPPPTPVNGQSGGTDKCAPYAGSSAYQQCEMGQ